MDALLAVEEARPTALPPPKLGIVPGGTVDAVRRLLAEPAPELNRFTRAGPFASAARPTRVHPGYPGSTRSAPSG